MVDIDIYYRMITQIEAQDMLREITVITYPKMSDSDRRSTHRKLYAQAYPQNENNKPVSAERVAAILGSL